jgi:segregation and condensation protein B
MGEEGDRRQELKKSVEALIFVSPEGIDRERLAEVLQQPVPEVERAVEELKSSYEARDSGLTILPVAEGYQMVTAPEVAPMIDSLQTITRKRSLTQAAMETLAIIAYRQPITRPEIEAVRGVDSGGVIGGLLEKKLIRMAGRKKAPGRPLIYTTSRDFLLHFGLESLRDLPVLSELGRTPAEQVEDAQENEGEA